MRNKLLYISMGILCIMLLNSCMTSLQKAQNANIESFKYIDFQLKEGKFYEENLINKDSITFHVYQHDEDIRCGTLIDRSKLMSDDKYDIRHSGQNLLQISVIDSLEITAYIYSLQDSITFVRYVKTDGAGYRAIQIIDQKENYMMCTYIDRNRDAQMYIHKDGEYQCFNELDSLRTNMIALTQFDVKRELFKKK